MSMAGHQPTVSAGSQPLVSNSGFGAVAAHPGTQKSARYPAAKAVVTDMQPTANGRDQTNANDWTFAGNAFRARMRISPKESGEMTLAEPSDTPAVFASGIPRRAA